MQRIGLLCLLIAVVLFGCGRGEENADPGPQQPDEETTTTSEAPTPTTDPNVESVETTSTSVEPEGEAAQTTTTVEINQSSPQAEQYTELAASGLVLSLDEQACADDAVVESIDAGTVRLDAVIGAVITCASPKAVDDFASELLYAGGAALPPTEAACVSSELRDGDSYRPFWSALFAEERFDFLSAEDDVQEQYLDLFATCVSVGRALSTQLGAALSPPTIGCIDDLYADSEFVRSSIEADLSADTDDVARVNGQIATCLTSAEREALGFDQ